MGQLVEVALEIDVALKEQAEKVFAENGLTLEQATILFFEETVRLGGAVHKTGFEKQILWQLPDKGC